MGESGFGERSGRPVFEPLEPKLLLDGVPYAMPMEGEDATTPLRSVVDCDVTMDGSIAGEDLGVWQQHYDPVGANVNDWLSADFNGDGKVEGGDLALWQQNYDPVVIPEEGSDDDLTITSNGDGIEYVMAGVPEYVWLHGCGPTAAGMIMGYWDGIAYPNLITGDATTQTIYVDQRIASYAHETDYALYGGVDDYGWIYWDESTYGGGHSSDSLADFMMTSWSSESACYSLTWPANVREGLEDFAEWVGYEHAETFRSEPNFEQFCSIIDSGRPVLLAVDSTGGGIVDHYVTGIGYRRGPPGLRQFACYNTWGEGVQFYDWYSGTWPPNDFSVYGMWDFRPVYDLPDMAPTYSAISATTLEWGDSFDFHYAIKNFGSEPATGFYIGFYLSSDTMIVPWHDVRLERWYMGTLDANEQYANWIRLTLPDTPPAGFTMEDNVRIGIYIDAEENVAEGSEGNNSTYEIGGGLEELAVSSNADLYGTEFTIDFPVLNTEPAGRVVRWTVHNGGSTGVGSFYVQFRLSENAAITTEDYYVDARMVPSLGPGEDWTLEFTTYGLPDTPPFSGDGSYYFGIIVDHNDQIEESLENNNSSRGLGLDMCEVIYGVSLLNIDFEHGDGALTIDNSASSPDAHWQLTTHRGSDDGHSGTHSIYYGRDTYWDYDSGHTYGSFTTKTMWLPDDPVVLTFNHFLDTEVSNLWDLPKVQVVEVISGETTTILQKYVGLPHTTHGEWEQVICDLSDWKGQMIKLTFSFDTVDELTNYHEGWYVDDLRVWSTYNPMAPAAFASLRYDSVLSYEDAEVEFLGDHMLFAFSEEISGGAFNIGGSTPGSQVTAAIAVYNRATGEMLALDADSGNGAVCQILNSGSRNTYIVEAWDLEEDSTGNVDVLVQGSAASNFETIALGSQGQGGTQGELHDEGQTKYYQIVSDREGILNLHVGIQSGDFYPQLTVWKNGGQAAVAMSADGHLRLTGVIKDDVFDIALSSYHLRGKGAFDLNASVRTEDPATLEGVVFYDRNADHFRTANYDPGLAGWLVWADLNDNGDLDQGEPYDYTDQAGNYAIANMDPGRYIVRCKYPQGQVPEDGWLHTRPGEPGDYHVSLTYDQVLGGADFGLILMGDANGDQKVDGGDLGIWQNNYDPLGSSPNNGFTTGDWDLDGKVDGGDLALWQQFYNPLGVFGGDFDPLA